MHTNEFNTWGIQNYHITDINDIPYYRLVQFVTDKLTLIPNNTSTH